MLAGSPLLAMGGLNAGLLGRLGGVALSAQEDDGIIGSLDEALEIMDFEPVAKKMMLPEHWGYLATGVDDDSTLRANVEAFTNYQIRMRRPGRLHHSRPVDRAFWEALGESAGLFPGGEPEGVSHAGRTGCRSSRLGQGDPPDAVDGVVDVNRGGQ